MVWFMAWWESTPPPKPPLCQYSGTLQFLEHNWQYYSTNSHVALLVCETLLSLELRIKRYVPVIIEFRRHSLPSCPSHLISLLPCVSFLHLSPVACLFSLCFRTTAPHHLHTPCKLENISCHPCLCISHRCMHQLPVCHLESNDSKRNLFS